MITQTTSLAIEALIYMVLEDAEGTHSPRVMAGKLDESPTYMQKVTHRLVEAGLLEARRGARGGVSLARRPDEISLFDVIEACQDHPRNFMCMYAHKTSNHCGLGMALLKAGEILKQQLSAVSIASIASGPCPSLETEMAEFCIVGAAHVACRADCSRRKAQGPGAENS